MPTAVDPSVVSSVIELRARIGKRELTSEGVVAAHVDRARSLNPKLNAIVADRYDAAMAEARAADRRLREVDPRELPPLHGIPCTIKECFELEGMPNSSGLVARKDIRSTGDAPAVARLRKAGAIPLGVTNLSELCMWMESDNRVYGRTNNPYDLKRTAGGSSGGEGASVGGGLAPFGLGSDIGGSIRMPAFFCGVFGHKPSLGWVPNAGQFPLAQGSTQRLLATGPLARRATDLWTLLEVLAGRELRPRPEEVDLRGLVVLDCPGNGFLSVSPELRAAQERALSCLSRLGMSVREWRSPRLERSIDIWAARMAASGESYAEMLGNGGAPARAWKEFPKWLVGRSDYTLASIGLCAAEGVMKVVGRGRVAAAADHEAELRAEMVQALGDDAVMLYPSYTRTAPRHGTPLLFPVQWAYTAVLNAMELPVTQVPLGLGHGGLPLGVQVVTAREGDARSVAVAIALEDAMGGWTPPAALG